MNLRKVTHFCHNYNPFLTILASTKVLQHANRTAEKMTNISNLQSNILSKDLTLMTN